MKKALAFTLILLLLCGACAAPGPVLRTGYLFAMDTFMELRIYGEEAQVTAASETIQVLEKRLSVTDPDSEIGRLNCAGEGDVSPETAALLQETLGLCARLEGALDISIYPVLRAWGFTTEEYRVPDREELDALLEQVDYEKIALEGEHVTLAPGMEIDLGSVAKGYASRVLAARLRQEGVTSAILNLGGNVQTVGYKPDGSLWRVAIQDPFGNGNLGVLEVADMAVVTSGGYERYFEAEGETWWHILDPATGYPAKNGLVSVTVIGTDGLLCDALSTGLFVLGPEGAAEYWRENPGFQAVLVCEDGSIWITAGLQNSFTPIENYAGAEVTVIERG